MQYYHHEKESEKYCFIFGYQENTKTIKLIFLTRERKKERNRKLKSEKSLTKTIAREEVRSQWGQPNASNGPGKKSNFEK